MASVFKATKNAKCYTIMYYDVNGKRRKKKGYSDNRQSQELAVKLETEAPGSGRTGRSAQPRVSAARSQALDGARGRL